jgi:ketosteroid isomerase-like protein
MSTELMDFARSGLRAWQAGDVDALQPLLDQEVELTWWKPGDWDCHGREAVLALLRKRTGQRGGAAEFELIDAGGELIIASRLVKPDAPTGSTPATLITFRAGRVITMRQFRDRSEALAAVQ